MKVLLITLALWMSAAQAFAEPIRPWWVEGAFASADLAPLSRPSAQPAALPERLPSVLTLIQRAADLHGVDADLLRALVAQETAYNAGEPAVDRCRCVPSYPETQDYVARVLVLRSASSGDAS